MATSYQRRPGDKAIPVPEIKRPDAALQAELQKAEAQKRALEQRGGDTQVDAEVLAKMQPGMGNSAIQALLNRGTETAVGSSGAEAAQEEQREKDEEQEEDKDKEAGEVEHILPSFSNAGGGGGGAPAPWALGRMFGGDDDDDDVVAESVQAGWRPMPVLPDPDEDIELGDVDGEGGPDDVGGLDFTEARAALGEVPWARSPLSRGLSHVQRLARREFGPEDLVDADGPELALGRLRGILRFVAAHGDVPLAAWVARAGEDAGEAAYPAAAGFSGALARAGALAEAVLSNLEPRWGIVVDVALEYRARAFAERAATSLFAEGSFSARRIFEGVMGEEYAPVAVELGGDAHAGVIAALERAAQVAPIPLVDLWEPAGPPPEEDEAVAAVDAVLRAFLGGEPETPRGQVTEEDVDGLFDAMDRLVGALGAAHVECASAALSVSAWIDHAWLAGLMDVVDDELRKVARRLVAAAHEVRGLLGSGDVDRVRALSADAATARGVAELLRRAVLETMGARVLARGGEPLERHPAEIAVERGRTDEARAALSLARGGHEGLVAGALLLRLGLPDEAEPALREALELPGAAGMGAASLLTGLLLARERWEEAESVALDEARRAAVLELPFAMADAALTRATARAARGVDWRGVLREAGAWLVERREGGAHNLLVARWAELAAEERASA